MFAGEVKVAPLVARQRQREAHVGGGGVMLRNATAREPGVARRIP